MVLNLELNNMKIYKSELKKHPFPRSLDSIKSLSIIRGSEAGYDYAEGFITLLIKMINLIFKNKNLTIKDALKVIDESQSKVIFF